jgi:hypothetical protein
VGDPRQSPGPEAVYFSRKAGGEAGLKGGLIMIQKVKVYEGPAQDRYRVTLLNGEWPDDETLIDWCDPNNFGGFVGQKTERFCVVTVYTD